MSDLKALEAQIAALKAENDTEHAYQHANPTQGGDQVMAKDHTVRLGEKGTVVLQHGGRFPDHAAEERARREGVGRTKDLTATVQAGWPQRSRQACAALGGAPQQETIR
jgi:hypothetical protein